MTGAELSHEETKALAPIGAAKLERVIRRFLSATRARASLMLPQEIIRKKREGEALDRAEIAFMVHGLTDGTVSEGQVAAFAMAVFFRGMSARRDASR